jgi:hypothetical protein
VIKCFFYLKAKGKTVMVIDNEHVAKRQQNMQIYSYSVAQDGSIALSHEGERQPGFFKAHLVRGESTLDSSVLHEIQRLLESATSIPMRYLRFQTGRHVFLEIHADADI